MLRGKSAKLDRLKLNLRALRKQFFKMQLDCKHLVSASFWSFWKETFSVFLHLSSIPFRAIHALIRELMTFFHRHIAHGEFEYCVFEIPTLHGRDARLVPPAMSPFKTPKGAPNRFWRLAGSQGLFITCYVRYWKKTVVSETKSRPDREKQRSSERVMKIKHVCIPSCNAAMRNSFLSVWGSVQCQITLSLHHGPLADLFDFIMLNNHCFWRNRSWRVASMHAPHGVCFGALLIKRQRSMFVGWTYVVSHLRGGMLFSRYQKIRWVLDSAAFIETTNWIQQLSLKQRI